MGIKARFEKAYQKAGGKSEFSFMSKMERHLKAVINEQFRFVYDPHIQLGMVGADGHSSRGGFRLQTFSATTQGWSYVNDEQSFHQAVDRVVAEAVAQWTKNETQTLHFSGTHTIAEVVLEFRQMAEQPPRLMEEIIRATAGAKNQMWIGEQVPAQHTIIGLPWRVRSGHSLGSVLEGYFAMDVSLRRLNVQGGSELFSEVLELTQRLGHYFSHLPMSYPGHAFRMTLQQPRLSVWAECYQNATYRQGFQADAVAQWMQNTPVDDDLAAAMVDRVANHLAIQPNELRDALVGKSLGEAREILLAMVNSEHLTAQMRALDKFLLRQLPVPIGKPQWQELISGFEQVDPALTQSCLGTAYHSLSSLLDRGKVVPQTLVLDAILIAKQGDSLQMKGADYLDNLVNKLANLGDVSQVLQPDEAETWLRQELAQFSHLASRDINQIVGKLTMANQPRPMGFFLQGMIQEVSNAFRHQNDLVPIPGLADVIATRARDTSIVRFADSNWQARRNDTSHDGRKYFAMVPNPGSGRLEVWRTLSNDTGLHALDQDRLFRSSWRIADKPQELSLAASGVQSSQDLYLDHDKKQAFLQTDTGVDFKDGDWKVPPDYQQGSWSQSDWKYDFERESALRPPAHRNGVQDYTPVASMSSGTRPALSGRIPGRPASPTGVVIKEEPLQSLTTTGSSQAVSTPAQAGDDDFVWHSATPVDPTQQGVEDWDDPFR